MVCPNMKKITLTSLREALLYERYEINVDENVLEGAQRALRKMLQIG
jgi:quinolinate synthase